MKKIKKRYLILGGLILVIGLSLWLRRRNQSDGPQVETARVRRSTIVETVMASGTVQPEKEVKISPEVSGEIIDLRVKEGQRVHRGDLLLRINPDLYQSALQRARAALSNARANLHQQQYRLQLSQREFERNKKLFEKGILAPKDFEKSKTDYQLAQAMVQAARYQVRSAEAGLKEARDNLKRTVIYAPTGGTVTMLNVEQGERVVGTKQMAGTEMLRIADLGRMEILAEINENDIVKIHNGDSVRIEIEAFPRRRFRGVVYEIANSAVTTKAGTDQVVNFRVKIRILKNSYADLMKGKDASYSPFRPGMTATVEVITRRKENVLSVPVSAVTMRTDSTGRKRETVFAYRDGKARRHFVRTGIQDEEKIEILEGLAEGDVVITGPYDLVSKRLHEGMRVSPKKAGSPGRKRHGKGRWPRRKHSR